MWQRAIGIEVVSGMVCWSSWGKEAKGGEREFAAARTGRGRAGALALGTAATPAPGWLPHHQTAFPHDNYKVHSDRHAFTRLRKTAVHLALSANLVVASGDAGTPADMSSHKPGNENKQRTDGQPHCDMLGFQTHQRMVASRHVSVHPFSPPRPEFPHSPYHHAAR
jgi:hypothetical protein